MIGQRPPPTTSKYQRHGPSFHGSPVDARMRNDERSCAYRPSPCAISARINVGETPSTFTRWRSTKAQSRSTSGKVGCAVVQHERSAVGEGADDLPRAHDPADVGEPEQPLAATQIGLERDFFGNLDGEAPVHVHRALGPAGGAARVRDEQRVLAVDGAGGEAVGAERAQRVERNVPAFGHRHIGAREARHHDNCVHGVDLRDCRVGRLLHRHDLAAPGEAVGRHQRDGARVGEADRDRVGP